MENMLTHFPRAIPEIPVSNVETAAEYYVNALGFHLDWYSDHDGYDFNWELQQKSPGDS